MEPGQPQGLIRTGLKARLPRGLSHPVGAEIISHALAGVPRYDSLWIAFGPKVLRVHPSLPVELRLELRGFLSVFSVVCNNASGEWYLSVPAVPSEARPAVRRLLLSDGLPAVRRWLLRPRPETWYEGFRVFEVLCPPETDRVCFLETVEHRVVEVSVKSVPPAP
jgi:hypothetical protein